MDNSGQSIRNRLLVARLPAMPQILSKLIALCQKDDVGIAELAKVIAHDTGMTSKVLGVASSSAYNFGNRKVSLVQALNTLGTETLKTLVITESVFQTFSNFSRMHTIDFRGFWVHSLKAAVLARELAKKMSYPHIEEAYLAGLIHDAGRLALLSASPEEYSSTFMTKDDEHLCSFEANSMGISHAEAGAWLIEQWNLDSFLADSVRYHHEPIARLKSAHPMIRLVCLAHLLGNYKIDSLALAGAGAICGIDSTDLNSVLSTANSQAKTAASYFGIELTNTEQEPPSAQYEPSATVRDRAQENLAIEVQNAALISSASQAFSRIQSGRELIESITRTARILFHLQDVIVLLHNSNSQVLTGVPIGDRMQRLTEFSIPLNAESVLTDSVLKRKVVFLKSGDSSNGLIEEQLLRIMGSDYLACLPMISGQSCQGVLVYGLSPLQAEALWGQERFLLSFSTQAASSLAASTSAREEIAAIIARVNENHREASRKASHEVNNPLAIIKNYLGVLDDKMTNNEPISEELTILNEEIDRVSRIVRGLSEQQPVQQNETTEVNSVLNEVVRLFSISRYLPASVNIIVKISDQPSEIVGSADPLKQILLNLIKNAVEALPKGGNIEVRNNGRLIRDGRAYFELCVSDNGAGIPSDVMAHLFTPGRSSKSGANRGLGLIIVNELVKNINGLISCRSGEWGTTFEILLPLPTASSTAGTGPTRVTNTM